MAVQYKSEGSLGPEQREGEGEHGVMMKSNVTKPLNHLSPSDIADDTLMRNVQKMENHMHVSYVG